MVNSFYVRINVYAHNAGMNETEFGVLHRQNGRCGTGANAKTTVALGFNCHSVGRLAKRPVPNFHTMHHCLQLVNTVM